LVIVGNYGLNISKHIIVDTMDFPSTPTLQQSIEKNELHKVKAENVLLKLRLVKIMIILENMGKTMERSRDAIVGQLSETGVGLPDE